MRGGGAIYWLCAEIQLSLPLDVAHTKSVSHKRPFPAHVTASFDSGGWRTPRLLFPQRKGDLYTGQPASTSRFTES